MKYEKLKIRTYGNENYSKAVQDLLFKLGHKWEYESTPYYDGSNDFEYIVTRDSGKITGYWGYPSGNYERVITFDDLVRMVEEKEREPQEMTVAEICKELGREIKIVKE
jgi:hypothetical protein